MSLFRKIPQESEASYLESWRPAEHDVDERRSEEPWATNHEECLLAWASEWKNSAAQHSSKEIHLKFLHKVLQIPNVLIPICLAPILASNLVTDNNPFLILALIISGLTGGLMPILTLEKRAEQHSQAEFRYRDMLSDLDALLAQNRRFRPRCDVTMQTFKMRMDMAAKLSPAVTNPDESEDSNDDLAYPIW